MPLLPSFLRPKQPQPQPQTTYFLSSPPPNFPLRPIPPPGSPRVIPQSNLIFSLTHPPPHTSEPTLFFLQCVPDPIGFLYHSSSFIQQRLSLDNTHSIEWRHQLIQLELEEKDGLAATSGGRIGVSLRWVEGIMRSVRDGERDMKGATREFKGVLLHELVHTIQHDGQSTCPGWLTESIADYIRLLAQLGPEHWRKSGSGRTNRGWEDGYDIGARFIEWLTGSTPKIQEESSSLGSQIPTQDALTSPTKTSVEGAVHTQYPNALPSNDLPPFEKIHKGRREQDRPGPFPDLIRLIDSRLKYERWDDIWWNELTGKSLEELWDCYLRYYGRSE
ncbi:hypothetical protein I302_100083 [Kwoniella bestiolae CBS 10118]|uniref:Peptidase of plants and bacteria-domain-containing protein n=1 Tax=Kwoniella bestiolae CBS 10118 TaxID=1296100 RepID=A0A1B9G454_9TREE|nr:hypothetical protein I302_03455 [Kwoniella bestiolae CBS 10118]OCF25782.1 hypothetical protein I302_03455 [Kwoniella bestiolae CBS 10118]